MPAGRPRTIPLSVSVWLTLVVVDFFEQIANPVGPSYFFNNKKLDLQLHPQQGKRLFSTLEGSRLIKRVRRIHLSPKARRPAFVYGLTALGQNKVEGMRRAYENGVRGLAIFMQHEPVFD